MMDKKIKHLEMIQVIIARLANNSFVFKSLAITVTAGIFSLQAFQDREISLFIPFFAILLFRGIDAYYLKLEQDYRGLYEEVRNKNERDIDFSMKPTNYSNYWCTIGKPILLFYYGIIIIGLFIYCLFSFY